MAKLRIGTCSWKYSSWHGLVYSAPKGIEYLREYASQYNTVEIDQWFWSLFGETSIGLPKPADVLAYRESVPDDFSFSVKLPNSLTLTHFYRKKKGDPLEPNAYFLSPTLLVKFLSLLDPMRDALGPVMFQFEYLNRQKMESQKRFQELFEGFLEQSPRSYQYAMEIRNPNYLNEKYFEFLERNGLGLVLLQGYYLPSIIGLYTRWKSYILQHKLVVIRLHGPDRQGIEKRTGKRWDQIVDPKDEELHEIAGMVTELRLHGVDVYVNVNNHYEGSAPLTIDRIKRLL